MRGGAQGELPPQEAQHSRALSLEQAAQKQGVPTPPSELLLEAGGAADGARTIEVVAVELV